MINRFKGTYAFLSNFYNAPVEYNGIKYQNSEAAFQACKCESDEERLLFSNLDGPSAKRLGKHVKLISDWDIIKTQKMYEVCKAKFEQNPDLLKKLLNTKGFTVVEGNTWNDTFWGVCNGQGKNILGNILMRIRDEFDEN